MEIKDYLKISVITPSFNQGEFIEDNILSIKNQNYPNYEHIIMDGGSTDNTLQILKKYPHLLWLSEKDKGQTHALNKALKMCSGDIVFWLNSDDMLCEDVFMKVNEYFLNNPDKFIIIGRLLFINENGEIFKDEEAVKINYEELLNGNQCVQQMSSVFRKEVFNKVGLFDEKYNYCMDHEMWVRLSQYYDFVTVDFPIGKFRFHSLSKTNNNQLKFVKEIFKLKLKHRAKIFSKSNLSYLFYFIKFPLKKIKILVKLVHKIKGIDQSNESITF